MGKPELFHKVIFMALVVGCAFTIGFLWLSISRESDRTTRIADRAENLSMAVDGIVKVHKLQIRDNTVNLYRLCKLVHTTEGIWTSAILSYGSIRDPTRAQLDLLENLKRAVHEIGALNCPAP